MSIKDYMTDDLGKIAEFEAACNEMIGTRYILAESKITKILQTVALSTVLQRIITTALNGFDYAAVARRWYDGDVTTPQDEKDMVAFTFCVLADIDNRQIDLNDFLRKFFWQDDVNTTYSAFCATLVEPFKNYVTGAIQRVDGGINEEEKDIKRKAMDLADAIEKHSGFSQSDKEEYILMCDSILQYAQSDTKSAHALALMLKRSIGSDPEIEPYILDVVNGLGN